MSKPLALFTSDWHLSPSPPSCRLETREEWWQCQLNCIQQVIDKATELQIPIFVVGDIFNDWYFSTSTNNQQFNELVDLLETIKYGFYTIYGQHDLCDNTKETITKTKYYTLDRIFKCDISNRYTEFDDFSIRSFAYDEPLEYVSAEISENKPSIALLHKLMWKGDEAPFIGASASGNIKSLANKLPDFDVIIAGDNHDGFVKYKDNQLFINCGSMMRRTIKFIDYKPFYTIYHGNDEYSTYGFDISDDKVTNETSMLSKFKDNRLATYTKMIIDKQSTKNKNLVNFKEKLSSYTENNMVHKTTKKLIHQTVEQINVMKENK